MPPDIHGATWASRNRFSVVRHPHCQKRQPPRFDIVFDICISRQQQHLSLAAASTSISPETAAAARNTETRQPTTRTPLLPARELKPQLPAKQLMQTSTTCRSCSTHPAAPLQQQSKLAVQLTRRRLQLLHADDASC